MANQIKRLIRKGVRRVFEDVIDSTTESQPSPRRNNSQSERRRGTSSNPTRAELERMRREGYDWVNEEEYHEQVKKEIISNFFFYGFIVLFFVGAIALGLYSRKLKPLPDPNPSNSITENVEEAKKEEETDTVDKFFDQASDAFDAGMNAVDSGINAISDAIGEIFG